jgi:diguanylate cyclase (GGDEF)-like protein
MSETVTHPAAIAPVRTSEALYRSDRTIIFRLHHTAAPSTTIRKEFLGPDAQARLRHEARMLERLAGLPGVSQLLATGPGTALVLRDSGGTPLAGVPPQTPAALVDLARRLARILADVHRRGVLHLDLSPANILHGGDGSGLELIDFHLATLAADERRDFTHHTAIAGTLAYIAPELTGRLGQAIDHRADLYQLGATLYELATGKPPFGHGDALPLIRDHLATLPVPPVQHAPDLPPLLSDLILRLLEKEPDRRYQSAEGLADDLDRLADALRRGDAATFPLGASDFPRHLAAPSRLVGRSAECAALQAAFDDALAGDCRSVLVSGPAGVGKTALIDQLRPIVTAQGGWFVARRFDQYRPDGASGPMQQVIRDIAALLLAEPEAALAGLRPRLQAALGADAGELLPLVPELQALIATPAEPRPLREERTRAAGLVFLQTVISPSRPLVMVLDDLQWAPENSLRAIADLLSADTLPGLLLLVGFRNDGPPPPPPLAALLRRWQQGDPARRPLPLGNLPPASLAELLGEMLRLPPEAAAQLAAPIGDRTAGNPSDTVELVNGLRRDKTLRRGPAGWEWDRSDIRRHVGQGAVSDLLRARLCAMPAATQDVLENMACLGDNLAPAVLAAASGLRPDVLDAALSPALEDGLLATDRQHLSDGGHSAIRLRFRNHRVHETVHAGMAADALRSRHLALARRLAGCTDQGVAAAEQYLAAEEAITAPDEQRRVATLFVAAADEAVQVFHHAAAARYQGAAIALLEMLPAPDPAVLTRLRTARLTALYRLGRYEEADQQFAALGPPAGEPLALAEATAVQVVSLSNRGRHREAVAIGVAMLEHLGIHWPGKDAADPDAAIAAGLAALRTWLAADLGIATADRRRTEDPLVRAAARLINRMLPSAQLLDPRTGAWAALASQRLWATHGVCPEVVANLARSAATPNVIGEDTRTGYDMARHAVAVGTAFGFEPETSLARQNFATFALHWFEPLEQCQAQIEAARQGLIRAGEIQAACINHIASLGTLFDTGPTLEAYAAELTAAREFATRTGNEHLFETFHNHHLLLQAVTGELDVAACLAQAPGPVLRDKPLGLFSFHCTRAMIASLFDLPAALARHSQAAMPMVSLIGGAYRCVAANTLRALSLAQEARTPGEAPPPDLGAGFARLRGWLDRRAADMPDNFRHLLLLVDAEAAWTRQDPLAAADAFDAALQCCNRQVRPWHHALIAERAGRFHLAHGRDYAGRALLRDALRSYAAWGAPALVRRLTAAHGFLEAAPAHPRAAADRQIPALSSDAVDLLGILRASHALSSQTTIGALHTSVVGTLAEMTGATAVRLVLWDDVQAAWCLPAEGDAPAEPIEAAAARNALPLSAFRYVERTRVPLLVDDATHDGRFARDSYFAGLDRCSLLVLPVQNQGATRAVLILENRLSRGVFSRARLDLVTLVASQLAVSLDNARLYASLERRVAERTEALAAANRQLEQLSISDPLTNLANRRRFDQVLHSEWQRALRGRRSIGLVMLDVDHFKLYNDRYGHLGGDRCLRAVAAVLQQGTRLGVDLAARYGGEEFGIILPGADPLVAAHVAERAHEAVLALHEPHAAAELGQVTISAGFAALIPDEATGPERLIELADAALYRAKLGGRNRVEA